MRALRITTGVLAPLLAAALLLSAGAAVARADEEPTDAGAGERYNHLTERLACACPDENWTRTLRGCKDRCADPYKAELRALVEGLPTAAKQRDFLERTLRPFRSDLYQQFIERGVAPAEFFAMPDIYGPEFGAAMVAGGTPDEKIFDLMAARYGPKMITETPFEGIHGFIYVFPAIALVLGTIVILALLRRRGDGAADGGGEAPAEADVDAPDDPYAKKLEEELEGMS